MKHVVLPDDRERRLVFYLAMEEYLAKHTDGDAFFLWQVPPTVIVGRNQLLASEVNLKYCRENGVQVYRRKSGGGCVYSDMGNIMVSYVVDGDDVPFVFETYMRRMALCLRNAGIDASVSGRNDIIAGGRKVSGNAFYSIHGRNVIHGTLLYDSSLGDMELAITPSENKLKSKGVASARQRVVNIRELLPESGPGSEYRNEDVFKEHIVRSFCDGETVLGPAEMAGIEEIEREYLSPDFISGRDPAATFSSEIFVPGTGSAVLSVTMRHGKIASVHVSGDILSGCRELEEALGCLSGVRAVKNDIMKALEVAGAGKIVPGLDITTLAGALAQDG